MKTILQILLLITFPFSIYSQTLLTPYEKDKSTTTTYKECIAYYKKLAEQSDIIKILEYGEADFGEPLHLVVVSKNKIFNPEKIRKSGKILLLVNNGIHAGEPDGIDASMMFVRDLVFPPLSVRTPSEKGARGMNNLLDNVVLITIPIYSIGGVMNRNNFTRVNQVGPKEFGFRGNAQNRDLNRDFIKCDTKNASTFVKIFQEWMPELFVDTHTTDGADYPYKMTYIAPLHDKAEPLASYMKNVLLPSLENDMKKKNFEMCPYVVTFKSTPDSGIVEFPETPRYSTGYTSLFNTIGFVSESHMLKTHQERVEATYEFLVSLLKVANTDFEKIKSNKKKADNFSKTQTDFSLSWQLDSADYSKYLFSGYEAKYKTSNITNAQRLYYDRNEPYKKEINFYNKYKPIVSVTKPYAYIIPKGWWRVIELLKLNSVEMSRLSKDQFIEVESYYIDTFQTRIPPFEGHYLHSNTKVRKVTQTRKFFKGDYVIYTNQVRNNFIIHVLEPEAVDSYFNWNFFDAVLQQKEGYDAYLFEDIADSLLNTNPELQKQFEDKKNSDEAFRNNPKAQLDFIYNNTIREPEYMRYPVGRLEKNVRIKLEP